MKKIAVGALFFCALFICGGRTVAEASNIDTYRNLLVNKTCTIKYENITPDSRETNKNKITMYGADSMNMEKSDYLRYKVKDGIIVLKGADKYEESGSAEFRMCRLTQQGRVFDYIKIKENGATNYVSDKGKGKVQSVRKNLLNEVMYGDSYGDPDVSWVFRAIMPDYIKTADEDRYAFVKQGWLSNGLNYEDWQSRGANGAINVIRYYFNQYTLVKIAAAYYFQDSDGRIQGKRCIIKINEFSPTPNESYLKLPSGLTDVTKKDKKGEL
jgi:hypothetical protein